MVCRTVIEVLPSPGAHAAPPLPLLSSKPATSLIATSIIFGKKLLKTIHSDTLIQSDIPHSRSQQAVCTVVFQAMLYIPSTLNNDYLLWHTQLIVCAVKY